MRSVNSRLTTEPVSRCGVPLALPVLTVQGEARAKPWHTRRSLLAFAEPHAAKALEGLSVNMHVVKPLERVKNDPASPGRATVDSKRRHMYLNTNGVAP